MTDEPIDVYLQLRKVFPNNIRGKETRSLLGECFLACLKRLESIIKVGLKSLVPGKEYFAFSLGKKISRAINRDQYSTDYSEWEKLVNALERNDYGTLSSDRITKTLYSVAISFCSYIDIHKDRDQKTPGTFFEYLIGHFFASRLGVDPTTRLPVLNLDMETTLPTDFVFNLGKEKAKFHLPVKISTRERVIQVWAHQRVLDGVYGMGRFLGTPVILTETKTDTKKHEVIEICLPDQWRIYQLHIAQLKRIYYLDVPVSYEKLNEVFPPLKVKPFGEFFFEADDLME